jgi:Raf kinase inhibitor-like YbhB/YbcL family protein
LVIDGKEKKMKLLSKSFQHLQKIPATHTCDGKNISPHLFWSDAPPETASFALSLTDPDAPGGNFIHWLVYDISKDVTEIPEGGPLPAGMKEVANDFGRRSYGGPCPPSGTHRYFFTLYALKSRELKDITRMNFQKEVQKNTLATAELVGVYARDKSR